MKTELKDVLHFYSGCEINCYFDEERIELDCTGILKSVNVIWKNGDVPWPLKVSVVRLPGHEYSYRADRRFHWDIVRPILRPLSDMKIEEGIWCLKQTFFDHINYPVCDFRLELVGENKQNPRISIDNSHYICSLTFGANGAIWNHTETNYKIRSEIFLYLLKQGFDLFGLIESGEAIDKTKINEVTRKAT